MICHHIAGRLIIWRTTLNPHAVCLLMECHHIVSPSQGCFIGVLLQIGRLERSLVGERAKFRTPAILIELTLLLSEWHNICAHFRQ